MEEMCCSCALTRTQHGPILQEWIVRIEDYSERVAKMYNLLQAGRGDKAKRLLPPEKVYPLAPDIGKRLMIDA